MTWDLKSDCHSVISRFCLIKIENHDSRAYFSIPTPKLASYYKSPHLKALVVLAISNLLSLRRRHDIKQLHYKIGDLTRLRFFISRKSCLSLPGMLECTRSKGFLLLCNYISAGRLIDLADARHSSVIYI